MTDKPAETILERMARALYERDKEYDWPDDVRLPFDQCKSEYVEDAKAAIEAIRPAASIFDATTQERYRLVIDAILNEEA